jgi:hypothetical protein
MLGHFRRGGRFGIWTPVQARNYIIPIPALRPSHPPLQWYRVSLPDIKRPMRSVDHSAHIALRIRMSWSIPLLPFCVCNNYSTLHLYVNRAIHILNQHTSIFFRREASSVWKYARFSLNWLRFWRWKQQVSSTRRLHSPVYTMSTCNSNETSEFITYVRPNTVNIYVLFYILLTVHHVMILGKWPTWCTNSFLCVYFYL